MASFWSKFTSGSSTVTQTSNSRFKTQTLVLRMQTKTREQFEQNVGGLTKDLKQMKEKDVEEYAMEKFGALESTILEGIGEIRAFVKSKKPDALSPKQPSESQEAFERREAEKEKANADFVEFMSWVNPLMESLKVWIQGFLLKIKQFLQELVEAKERGEDYVGKTDDFIAAMGDRTMEISSFVVSKSPGPSVRAGKSKSN